MHRRVRMDAPSAHIESYERIERTGCPRLRRAEHERRFHVHAEAHLQTCARPPCFSVVRLQPAIMRHAAFTLLLLGSALCLRAQVPATWVPGHVETRSHDYDLVH